LALGLPAAPAAAEHGSWARLTRGPEACIGGDLCGHHGWALELPLDPRAPVLAVRFFAHDDVGNHSRGALRVSIDGELLADHVDVRRRGRVHEIGAPGFAGRVLVLEAATDDEVVIEDVEVLYGGRPYGPAPRSRPAPGPDPGGWRTLTDEAACFGGDLCGHYGWALEMHLGGAPVYGLRIYAHDDVGRRSRGLLRVVLDGRVLADGIDVRKLGGVHELAVPGIRARHLVLEAVSNDEVVVDRVEVLERRRRGRY
jgi:hypothetical protein